MTNQDDAVGKIINCWRRRKLIKTEYYNLASYLYERERRNISIIMLIDASVDDRIDFLIELYNKRAEKLKLLTFDEFEILYSIPFD